jgi:hypothetical protein
MKRLHYPALLIACFVYGYAVVPSHAAQPRKLAPPVPCTMQNRMDMFVDEDNILWECTCETLKSGHICRWQVIGGVDAIPSRKLRKQHTRTIIRYARPAVVA